MFTIAGGDGGIAYKGVLDSSRVHPQRRKHILEEVHSKGRVDSIRTARERRRKTRRSWRCTLYINKISPRAGLCLSSSDSQPVKCSESQSVTLVLYIHEKLYIYSITGERTKLEDPDAAEALSLPEKSVRMTGLYVAQKISNFTTIFKRFDNS